MFLSLYRDLVNKNGFLRFEVASIIIVNRVLMNNPVKQTMVCGCLRRFSLQPYYLSLSKSLARIS